MMNDVFKSVAEEMPQGIRVLVADDTIVNVMLMKSILKRLNVAVDSAVNGAKALELLNKNNYDLVLTDINMPVMDGIELTKQIRSHPNPKIQSLPVIVLTGSNLKEATERIKEVGVTDCLLKPFSQNDFVEMIRRNLIKH
jgi:CheY-like chemotaxis protein